VISLALDQVDATEVPRRDRRSSGAAPSGAKAIVSLGRCRPDPGERSAAKANARVDLLIADSRARSAPCRPPVYLCKATAVDGALLLAQLTVSRCRPPSGSGCRRCGIAWKGEARVQRWSRRHLSGPPRLVVCALRAFKPQRIGRIQAAATQTRFAASWTSASRSMSPRKRPPGSQSATKRPS
jgi:hypothetical protein